MKLAISIYFCLKNNNWYYEINPIQMGRMSLILSFTPYFMNTLFCEIILPESALYKKKQDLI